MTGKALICELKNLSPIEGADSIQQANLFGETVIVPTYHKEGDIGLLFDCETQLSHEFCSANNLYRRAELNADKTKTGFFEDHRRVRPIKLKGVKCSGFWMPVSCLDFTGEHFFTEDIAKYLGVEIDSNNNIPICQKYITKQTRASMSKNQGGKAKENLCPTFREHVDTDQALRNLHLIQEGNLVTITEKLHGTSGRCGYLPVKRKKSLFETLLNKFGVNTLDNEYDFIVGSRRVVKRIGEEEREGVQSFYDTDIWSQASECFKGKLNKGETVYFEIVGYLPDGTPIMGSHSNDKLKKFLDKDEYIAFVQKYGNTTEFSYGCVKGEHKVFVYRITMTNEDGEAYDLTWDQVKRRCERLGIEACPELTRFIAYDFDKDTYESEINNFTNNDSWIFKQHLKEGIIVRIDNGANTPIFLKNKSYAFKCLEGIVKDSDTVDVEESQG